MNKITLYYAPITCARVPLILLEEAGAPFEVALLRLKRGDHKTPAYKQLNPLGKVPTIVIDGEPLTENVAIVEYLHELFPEAGLIPKPQRPIDRARRIADLCFCAATLHPFVSRICVPMSIAPPEAQAGVRQQAEHGIKPHLQIVESRLERQPWWYGDTWSAMDVYLHWAMWRLGTVGFDFAAFPRIAEHSRRIEARPATRRALARDQEALATLEAEGMTMKP